MIKNNEELQIQDVVTIRVSRCVENLILVLYISIRLQNAWIIFSVLSTFSWII